MPESLKLAAICMTSGSDKTKNVEAAIGLVRQAAKAGADWVQLPEIFPFHGSYEIIHEMAEFEDGPLNQKLAALARELKIVLFAGTVGERPRDLSDDQVKNKDGHRRVYNTSYVFGRDGALLGKYRKTHLFNLLGDDGRPRYCESDGFIQGDTPQTLKVEGLTVGLSICYDLRFPELYTKLGRNGHLDVICVPSAFTKGTGMYHWELLLRARAVENQAYVFAANQTGVHAPGKESWGHAMVIDPWGTVLADTGEAPGVAVAAMSLAALADIRGRLPALKNRRPELYR